MTAVGVQIDGEVRLVANGPGAWRLVGLPVNHAAFGGSSVAVSVVYCAPARAMHFYRFRVWSGPREVTSGDHVYLLDAARAAVPHFRAAWAEQALSRDAP